MTRELLNLLRRVEAAGGPVTVNKGKTLARIHGLIEHAPVTAFFGAWQPLDDATLIHALRLDARERGIFVHEVTDRRATGEGFDVQFDPLVWGASGRHENEVCAWLLAWLDAFEEPE